MKRIIFSFMACLLSLMATAQVILVTSAPPAGASHLKLNETAELLQFTAAADTKTVEVTTNLNYTIAANDSWCQVTKTTKGFTVSVDAATQSAPRTTTLNLTARDGHSRTLTVSQLGTESDILTSSSKVELNDNATAFSITVTANTEVTVQTPDWITTKTSGSGVSKYEFIATQLAEEGTSRTGEITFTAKNGTASASVSVTQTFRGYPRFAVMSDTHFGNNVGEGPMVKVPRALKNIQARAGKLDAIFICGDLTDWGKPEQYKLFQQVFDDRDIVPADLPVYVMMGNHDNYADGALQNYLVLNQPYHRLIDIKGYPFITTSMNGGGWDDYSAEELAALDANLAEAAKRYPGKPIFVFTHVPPMNTVYGTCTGEGGWGSNVLTPYLKKYPQIVIFGGHSHFPLSDPRSIHQADFTTINDGSVTYSEIEPGVVNEGIHPDQYENVTEACLVSLDQNMNVEIQRWDTYGNEEILPRWHVQAPHDGSRFIYTKDRTGGDAPVWEAGSVAEVSDVADQACKVTFPQAKDDENVHHYVIEIVSEGNIVTKHSIFSSYYLNSRMPKTLTAHIKGLPDGHTLKARVIAYDSYKNTSTALESAEFTTKKYVPSPDAKKPTADLFDLRFANDGTANDISAHGIEVKTGSTTPTVAFNELYNRNAATFTGSSSCFYRIDYANDETIKAAFTNGFSYELFYRPNNTNNVCPLSAQESGGAGIEQASGGQIQFYCHVGGGYKVLKSSVTAEAGQFYHVVAVYDHEAQQTRIYINGVPAGEMAASGSFGFPSDNKAQWIAVGGDCNGSGNAQYSLNGDVMVARMYTKALTRDEAFLLYEDIKNTPYTPCPETKKPTADLFDIQFATDGTASDASANAVEVVAGSTTATIVYDEAFRRNVATFDGTNQCYYRIDYDQNDKIKAALANGFSLEVLYSPEEIKNVCPLSSQESGGAGIEQASDGNIQFYCYVDGSYKVVKSLIKAESGKYYHVIAVYDRAAERVKLYIDGKPAGDLTATGNFQLAKDGAHWFCIGGDAHPSYPSQLNLSGKIVTARMYAHPLTRDEAYLLYDADKAK